jgi:hypothetical protein
MGDLVPGFNCTGQMADSVVCFSMIMHGLMSQGSVHNSRKLKMSQPAYSSDIFWILWIYMYIIVFHFPPIWRGVMVTPGTDWLSDPRQAPFFWRYLWPTDAYLYSQSCEIYRLGPFNCLRGIPLTVISALQSIRPFNSLISLCNAVKSLKLLHVAFISLFSGINSYFNFLFYLADNCVCSRQYIYIWVFCNVISPWTSLFKQLISWIRCDRTKNC